MPLTPLENMDDPSPDARLTYPGEWWNKDDTGPDYEWQSIQNLPDADIVSISDTDTDGLTCFAILELAYPEKNVVRVPSGHTSGVVDVEDTMELVTKHAPVDATVYITDICPNDEQVSPIVENILHHNGDVHVYDHHQWDEMTRKLFEKHVEEFDVREEQDVCAADVLLEHMEMEERFDTESERFSRLEELVNITRDHDIWIKQDKRSDVLSDFQRLAEIDEFVETVKKYGGDLMKHANESLRSELEKQERQKDELIEVAVKQANWVRVVITNNNDVFVLEEEDSLPEGKRVQHEIVVAITYGTAYPSGLGDVLCRGWSEWQRIDEDKRSEYTYEEHFPEIEYESNWYRPGDADITAIIPPWNKTSFRSGDEYPVCDIIAEEFGNGGGHKEAAGCEPNIVGRNYDVSIGVHWETKGAEVKGRLKNALKDAFEEFVGTDEWDERVDTDMEKVPEQDREKSRVLNISR